MAVSLVGVSYGFDEGPEGQDFASVTVNYPTGTSNGDLVIAFVYCGDFDLTNDGTSIVTKPASGWTELQFYGGAFETYGYGAYSHSYSSGSSVTFDYQNYFGASGRWPGITLTLMTFRGAEGVDVSARGTFDDGSSNSILAPSVTTTADDCMVAVFAAAMETAGGNSVSWTSATERSDHDSSIGDRWAVTSAATYMQASAGATGSRVATFSGFMTGRNALTVAIAPALAADIDVTDSGSGSDSVALANNPSVSDSGSGSDTAPMPTALYNLVESGTGSDGVATTASFSIQETGSTADTGIIGEATFNVSDSATATDEAEPSNAVLVDETGSVTDADIPIGVGLSEAGTAVDEQDLAVDVQIVESGSGVDSAIGGSAVDVDEESGLTTEAAGITVAASDSGSGSESGQLGVLITDEDEASGSEQPVIGVEASDANTGFTEDVFQSSSGELIASRVQVILPEVRVLQVRPESRILEIEGEVRKLVVPYED